jgi:hypothetical protein
MQDKKRNDYFFCDIPDKNKSKKKTFKKYNQFKYFRIRGSHFPTTLTSIDTRSALASIYFLLKNFFLVNMCVRSGNEGVKTRVINLYFLSRSFVTIEVGMKLFLKYFLSLQSPFLGRYSTEN